MTQCSRNLKYLICTGKQTVDYSLHYSKLYVFAVYVLNKKSSTFDDIECMIFPLYAICVGSDEYPVTTCRPTMADLSTESIPYIYITAQ